MPDEYWVKIGNTPKPERAPKIHRVPVVKEVSKDKEAIDAAELFWCPTCKESQKEKRGWGRNIPHVRCRSCGAVIHLKNKKAVKEPKLKFCKTCNSKLRSNNNSGTCELCNRS